MTVLYNVSPNVVTGQYLKITDDKEMPEKRKMIIKTEKSFTVIDIIFHLAENVILRLWV